MAVSLVLMGSIFGMSARSAEAVSVGHVLPAIDTAVSIPNYGTAASHNGYVVLQAWQTQKMQELKRQNPNIKVLVYKNLGFASASRGPEGLSPSGVASDEAKPSWFLKNTSGNSFTSTGFNWLWAMDVGSREYQEKWAQNVIAELTSKGWDGVMLDDANATMKYQYTPSAIAKYPNDASYAAAMESALSYIGPQIQAAGKLAIPNFATWVEFPQTYNRWLQYVSGGLDEMFVKWGRSATGEGYREPGQWKTQVEEARYATQHGKVFLAYTQGVVGDTQAARYGYASLLMGGEEGGACSYAYTPNYATEQWMPEYEYEIGSPTGLPTAGSNGVYTRPFSNGLVVVNPTASTQSVSFGGTYSGSGLTNATGATMPAHSALVLYGEAAPAAPTTPVTTPVSAPTTPVSSPTPPVTAPTPPVTSPMVPPKVEPITVTVSVSAGEVGLTWTPGAPDAVSYEVTRDDKPVAKTSARHRRDAGVRTGKRYRYGVVARDRKGRIVASSRLFTVRPSKTHRTLLIHPAK